MLGTDGSRVIVNRSARAALIVKAARPAPMRRVVTNLFIQDSFLGGRMTACVTSGAIEFAVLRVQGRRQSLLTHGCKHKTCHKRPHPRPAAKARRRRVSTLYHPSDPSEHGIPVVSNWDAAAPSDSASASREAVGQVRRWRCTRTLCRAKHPSSGCLDLPAASTCRRLPTGSRGNPEGFPTDSRGLPTGSRGDPGSCRTPPAGSERSETSDAPVCGHVDRAETLTVITSAREPGEPDLARTQRDQE
jgi:hypothetical protein